MVPRTGICIENCSEKAVLQRKTNFIYFILLITTYSVCGLRSNTVSYFKYLHSPTFTLSKWGYDLYFCPVLGVLKSSESMNIVVFDVVAL